MSDFAIVWLDLVYLVLLEIMPWLVAILQSGDGARIVRIVLS